MKIVDFEKQKELKEIVQKMYMLSTVRNSNDDFAVESMYKFVFVF